MIVMTRACGLYMGRELCRKRLSFGVEDLGAFRMGQPRKAQVGHCIYRTFGRLLSVQHTHEGSEGYSSGSGKHQ